MNTRLASGERRVELHPNRAVSVAAKPGTVVHCLEGEFWLTQGGFSSDYVLIPGAEFVSASDGKIVLTALDRASTASVQDARPGFAGSGLRIDAGVIERLTREATALRNAELGRLLHRLGAVILSAWRSLVRRGAPASPRGYRGKKAPARGATATCVSDA